MSRLATLLLALIIALSSVTMAAARHQPRAVGMTALCTGSGFVMLALDAKGNPAGPMLPCPDCTPALGALVDQPAAVSGAPLHLVPLEWRAAGRSVPPAGAPTDTDARGPPARV